jgi:hypothetical protein
MQNHEQKKKSGKKWKTKFLWTKQNIFLAPCPSATWLHVGAPQKIHEK